MSKKVLYVFSRTVNEGYLRRVLEVLHNQNRIKLFPTFITDYAQFDTNLQNQFDVLIYNTHPHQFHYKKWNHKLFERTDSLYLSFKGPKILFDSHDSGYVDAFSRFNDKTLPRIKTWPAYDILNEINVIQTIPGGGHLLDQSVFDSLSNPQDFDHWKSIWPNEKTISATYIVSYYGEFDDRNIEKKSFFDYGRNKYIREDVRDLLKTYSKIPIDMERKPLREFLNHLKHTLVSISVPGWGEGCARQYEAPTFGCLNFLHESIANIKLLPHVDLVDGEDFISFNLNNLVEKLDYVFNNLDRIHQIRYNGAKKLREGFDINKSADKLFNYIQTL